MTSPRTVGDEAVGMTLDAWQMVSRHLDRLPIEYRREAIKVIANDLHDKRDRLDDAFPRLRGPRR